MDNNKLLFVSYLADLGRSSLSSDDLLLLETNPKQCYWDNLPSETCYKPVDYHLLAIPQSAICFHQKIYNYLSKFNSQNNQTLYIYPGFISFGSHDLPILRFRESQLPLAQNFIKYLQNNLNIKFKKNKHFKPTLAIVNYEKFINLEQIHKGIFKDKNSKNMYLIEIYSDIPVEKIYHLADIIWNSYNFAVFEPYKAEIIENINKIRHFFMFYSLHCNPQKINEFKNAIIKHLNELS